MTIENGLFILDKRMKRVNKRLSVKLVYSKDDIQVLIFFTRYFVFKTKFGEIQKLKFSMLDPKLINMSLSDYRFIRDCIKDFQESYL